MHPKSSEFRSKFLTNTDDTGRFIVVSQRTGKTYYVEPIMGAHTPEWGSIDPATGNLMHKKGDGKYKGGIKASESLITVENGFQPDKIHLLDIGTSPTLAIEFLDSKYPDKE
jgi:hypothetical protein